MADKKKRTRAALKVGNQKPTFEVRPKTRGGSDADYCIELVEGYGLGKCLPWQRHILQAWLARTTDGAWASPTCGLSVPRQNGKNYVIEARELYGLTVLGESILHTANSQPAAREAFQRLSAYFSNEEEHPDLVEMLVKNGIRQSNGQWSITLKNGGIIYFNARSQGVGRSMSCNLVIFDEAQALKETHFNSIMPVLAAAAGDRQMIFTGTPPDGNEYEGSVFKRLHKEAHETDKRNPSIIWAEWGVQDKGDDPEATIRDKANWYLTNPSMGYLIDQTWIETAELNKLSTDGFLVERLGYWPDDTEYIVPAISVPRWNNLRRDPNTIEHRKNAKIACGIRFSPDGQRVAICFSEVYYDKRNKRFTPAHIEMAAYENIVTRGTGWIADIISDNARKVSLTLIDGLSNADDLINKLVERKVNPKAYRRCTTNEATAAASMLVNSVIEDDITHIGQMQLDDSVKTSEKSMVGKTGAYTFSGEMPEPVQAAAIALYAVRTTKRNPKRRSRLL